jgi:sulfopyruvate decarboxylase TPP-binding subunit
VASDAPTLASVSSSLRSNNSNGGVCAPYYLSGATMALYIYQSTGFQNFITSVLHHLDSFSGITAVVIDGEHRGRSH